MAIPGRRTPHSRRVHVLPSFSPDHLAAASCKLKSRESSLSPRRRGSRPEESALVLSLDQVFFLNLDSSPFLLGWNRNAVRRSLYFRIFLLPIYVSLASTLRPSLPLPVDPCLASSPRSLRQRPPFTTLDMYDFRAVETHFLPVRASTLRPFRSFTVPAYPAHKKRWQKQVSDKRDWIDYYSPFSLPMRRSLESSNIPNGNHYISLNKKNFFWLGRRRAHYRSGDVTLSTFRHWRYVPKLQRLSLAPKDTASYEAALH